MWESYLQQGSSVYSHHFIFNSCPLPLCIWSDQRSHQMCWNLLHGLSKPYLYIHHCSALTSITYNHPSLLHRHTSFIHHSFHTINPSCLWPSFESYSSHIRSYYSLHQTILLYIPICPSHLNTQLCLTSQLSCNTCSPLHLISHSVYTCYSTHTP